MPGRKIWKEEKDDSQWTHSTYGYSMRDLVRKLSFEELQAQRPSPLEAQARQRLPVSVLLDDIRSLHNVGAVFRTSDAVALEHLYLCGISGTPPRSEIRKTSLGAEETVPWSYHPDPVAIVRDLAGQGYQIVVLEQTTTSIDYGRAEYRFPLCLIVGHEYNGVAEELVRLADMAIDLPMLGVKHSLNVSVAFGVAIYKILQHWEEKNNKSC
jgi:tRNA G18 (ribose-2'-O)-methylase SpoU